MGDIENLKHLFLIEIDKIGYKECLLDDVLQKYMIGHFNKRVEVMLRVFENTWKYG